MCLNTRGSYKCLCQTGFREDKAACVGEFCVGVFVCVHVHVYERERERENE